MREPAHTASVATFARCSSESSVGDGLPPLASYGGGRGPYHRWVLRRPNSGAYSSQAPGASDTAGRNADRESSAGAPGGHPGGCKRALERTVLLKGGLQPPHSADATTRLHNRRTGPDRRARLAAASDQRRRLDRERGGPGRGRAGAGAASLAAGDDPRGQGGHRETARGLQTSLGKNVLFKGGLQPPRAIQGPEPFSNGLAPRSPATRARISSKAAAPAESQGKAADWRCIRAHFPVRNQVIP